LIRLICRFPYRSETANWLNCVTPISRVRFVARRTKGNSQRPLRRCQSPSTPIHPGVLGFRGKPEAHGSKGARKPVRRSAACRWSVPRGRRKSGGSTVTRSTDLTPQIGLSARRPIGRIRPCSYLQTPIHPMPTVGAALLVPTDREKMWACPPSSTLPRLHSPTPGCHPAEGDGGKSCTSKRAEESGPDSSGKVFPARAAKDFRPPLHHHVERVTPTWGSEERGLSHGFFRSEGRGNGHPHSPVPSVSRYHPESGPRARMSFPLPPAKKRSNRVKGCSENGSRVILAAAPHRNSDRKSSVQHF